MTRKNLAESGLQALVGGFNRQPDGDSQRNVPKGEEVHQRSVAPPATEEISQEAPRKPGRPKGTKADGEPRQNVCFRLLESHHAKLSVMARLAGCSRQALLDVALERLICSFEQENGAITAEEETVRFNVNF